MPTYLLWGANTYASTQKRRQIVNRYLEKYGALNCGVFEAADLTIERYRDMVGTIPLLATTRLVVLLNIISQAKPTLKDYIEQALTQVPEDTIVIFHETKLPDRRSKLFKTLNQPKRAQHFDIWTASTTISWLARLAEEKGGSLTPDAARSLIDRVGHNPWLLDQELTKLITFSPIITPDTIARLTPAMTELSTFAVIDALHAKHLITFLKTCDQLQAQGNTPQYLVSLINAGLRQIALVLSQPQGSPWQIAKQTGLPVFVVQKIRRSTHWSLHHLRLAYHHLVHLDTAVKLGTIEPSVALDVFATKALTPVSKT